MKTLLQSYCFFCYVFRIGCISTNGREYSLTPPLQYAAPEMVFNTAGGSGFDRRSVIYKYRLAPVVNATTTLNADNFLQNICDSQVIGFLYLQVVNFRCGFSSDVFSLGLIMYEAICSSKQPLLDLRRDDTSNYQSQVCTYCMLHVRLLLLHQLPEFCSRFITIIVSFGELYFLPKCSIWYFLYNDSIYFIVACCSVTSPLPITSHHTTVIWNRRFLFFHLLIVPAATAS